MELQRSNAGQDVMLLLPTDWVILDGRGSVDDHGIVRYEWTLLQGDPSVDLKSPQPGMLKLTNLREGVYVVQLSVTDTVGQKSSDNITVTVLLAASADCTGICTRYQFICDDGCCIDIILACDGTAQCSDESDEAFCQINTGRKSVTHTTLSGSTTQSRTTGLNQNDAIWSSVENVHKVSMEEPRPLQPHGTSETQSPVAEGGKPDNGLFPGLSTTSVIVHYLFSFVGAVLPLALGLAITALLLLMVGCRLRLVRQKLKKVRPISSEESDYLINGMYL
uniref:Low-density lipoprotein receptor-related protein 11 n=1 Tax=Callorhinchus milii TaxID=7868 RepID=A0A4W3HD82_CALMI